MVQSGRHDGTDTSIDDVLSTTPKPIGCRILAITSDSMRVPRRASTLSTETEIVAAVGYDDARTMVAPSCNTMFGDVSERICTNRRVENECPSGSTPRSNRNEASLRKPWRWAEKRIGSGENQAISRLMTEVDSVISECRSPITPARPTGASVAPSQINRSSTDNVRSTPSRVTRVSPARAMRIVNELTTAASYA